MPVDGALVSPYRKTIGSSLRIYISACRLSIKGRAVRQLLTVFLQALKNNSDVPHHGFDVLLFAGREGEVAEAVPLVKLRDGFHRFPLLRRQAGQGIQKLKVSDIAGFEYPLGLQALQHLTVHLNGEGQAGRPRRSPPLVFL